MHWALIHAPDPPHSLRFDHENIDMTEKQSALDAGKLARRLAPNKY